MCERSRLEQSERTQSTGSTAHRTGHVQHQLKLKTKEHNKITAIIKALKGNIEHHETVEQFA